MKKLAILVWYAILISLAGWFGWAVFGGGMLLIGLYVLIPLIKEYLDVKRGK